MVKNPCMSSENLPEDERQLYDPSQCSPFLAPPVPFGSSAPPPSNPVLCGSYLRQLWGIYKCYSLGFTSTLSQFFKPSSTNSGEKFIMNLRKVYAELEGLGILLLEYDRFETLSRLKGAIITANHPSGLDVLALLNKVPRLTCIMRASLKRNLVIQGPARMIGCIPNDAGAAFIRQAERKLKAGENLLIFPEGTRTTSGRTVNPFKKGFALIAVRNQFPIHTILIERKNHYLAKGGSVLAPTRLPIRLRLKAGKIFYPESDEKPRALSARLQRYFQSVLRISGNEVCVIESAV
ncbi:MAG: hypothetical protein C5B47_01690 [Verrucomicrobia bacterium]|nr:MAG: hypothetical protein C5B47_01690 [Verrucomicrobiota bacterium]